MEGYKAGYFRFLSQLKGFSKRLHDQGKSESYCTNMVKHIDEFLVFLEQRGLKSEADIEQEDIDAYFHYLEYRPNQRKAGGLSTSYINKHREAVLRFMEYIKQTKLGASGFYVPYLKHQTEIKEVLTIQEVMALYQSTDNGFMGITNRVILSMLYGCGLRKGELHNLEVNDIDLSQNHVWINHTKTRQARMVVLSPMVKMHLEEYIYRVRGAMLPAGSKEPYLLVTERGKRMSLHTIPFRVNYMQQKAGLKKKITPHTLRHSIATHLLEDLSLEEVSAFLGHTHLDSTQIYTHLKEELL